MTRKDYVLIATTLATVRKSYAPNWDPNLFRALNDVARELSINLAVDNERFDRERFLAAAGVGL